MERGSAAAGAAPKWHGLQGAARIARELKHLHTQIKKGAAPQLSNLETVNDDLFCWRMAVNNFDEDTPAGAALNKDLRTLSQKHGQDHLLFELRFPQEYPTQPFFARIVRPRCVMYTGHVTAGGSICIKALVPSGPGEGGWQADYSAESVLQLVLTNMVDCEVTTVQTATGGSAVTGPLRIDLRLGRSVLMDYSSSEAQAAYDRTVARHGWGSSNSGRSRSQRHLSAPSTALSGAFAGTNLAAVAAAPQQPGAANIAGVQAHAPVPLASVAAAAAAAAAAHPSSRRQQFSLLQQSVGISSSNRPSTSSASAAAPALQSGRLCGQAQAVAAALPIQQQRSAAIGLVDLTSDSDEVDIDEVDMVVPATPIVVGDDEDDEVGNAVGCGGQSARSVANGASGSRCEALGSGIAGSSARAADLSRSIATGTMPSAPTASSAPAPVTKATTAATTAVHNAAGNMTAPSKASSRQVDLCAIVDSDSDVEEISCRSQAGPCPVVYASARSIGATATITTAPTASAAGVNQGLDPAARRAARRAMAAAAAAEDAAHAVEAAEAEQAVAAAEAAAAVKIVKEVEAVMLMESQEDEVEVLKEVAPDARMLAMLARVQAAEEAVAREAAQRQALQVKVQEHEAAAKAAAAAAATAATAAAAGPSSMRGAAQLLTAAVLPEHWNPFDDSEKLCTKFVTLPWSAGRSNSAPKATAVDKHSIKELQMNGFTKEDSMAALQHCDGDLDAALLFALEAMGNGGACAAAKRGKRNKASGNVDGASGSGRSAADVDDTKAQRLEREKQRQAALMAEAETVAAHFEKYQGVQRNQIVGIERVQNWRLLTKYQMRRSEMLATLGTEEALNEKTMWHGSSFNIVSAICMDGFDMRVASSGGALGAGVYFAMSSTYSIAYCAQIDRAVLPTSQTAAGAAAATLAAQQQMLANLRAAASGVPAALPAASRHGNKKRKTSHHSSSSSVAASIAAIGTMAVPGAVRGLPASAVANMPAYHATTAFRLNNPLPGMPGGVLPPAPTHQWLGSKAMLMCRVMLGNIGPSVAGARRPLPGFDSAGHMMEPYTSGSIAAVFDNAQAIPEYIVHLV